MPLTFPILFTPPSPPPALEKLLSAPGNGPPHPMRVESCFSSL